MFGNGKRFLDLDTDYTDYTDFLKKIKFNL